MICGRRILRLITVNHKLPSINQHVRSTLPIVSIWRAPVVQRVDNFNQFNSTQFNCI